MQLQLTPISDNPDQNTKNAVLSWVHILKETYIYIYKEVL
jgi:hypothetical protein